MKKKAKNQNRKNQTISVHRNYNERNFVTGKNHSISFEKKTRVDQMFAPPPNNTAASFSSIVPPNPNSTTNPATSVPPRNVISNQLPNNNTAPSALQSSIQNNAMNASPLTNSSVPMAAISMATPVLNTTTPMSINGPPPIPVMSISYNFGNNPSIPAKTAKHVGKNHVIRKQDPTKNNNNNHLSSSSCSSSWSSNNGWGSTKKTSLSLKPGTSIFVDTNGNVTVTNPSSSSTYHDITNATLSLTQSVSPFAKNI